MAICILFPLALHTCASCVGFDDTHTPSGYELREDDRWPDRPLE